MTAPSSGASFIRSKIFPSVGSACATVTHLHALINPKPVEPSANANTTRAVLRAIAAVLCSIRGRGGRAQPTTPVNASSASVSVTVASVATIRSSIDSAPHSTSTTSTATVAASVSIAPGRRQVSTASDVSTATTGPRPPIVKRRAFRASATNPVPFHPPPATPPPACANVDPVSLVNDATAVPRATTVSQIVSPVRATRPASSIRPSAASPVSANRMSKANGAIGVRADSTICAMTTRTDARAASVSTARVAASRPRDWASSQSTTNSVGSSPTFLDVEWSLRRCWTTTNWLPQRQDLVVVVVTAEITIDRRSRRRSLRRQVAAAAAVCR